MVVEIIISPVSVIPQGTRETVDRVGRVAEEEEAVSRGGRWSERWNERWSEVRWSVK